MSYVTNQLAIEYIKLIVLTTIYLINHTPSPLFEGKYPYKVLFFKPFSYSHLKGFGCLYYTYNITKLRDFIVVSTRSMTTLNTFKILFMSCLKPLSHFIVVSIWFS
jgi:hypothetical protein